MDIDGTLTKIGARVECLKSNPPDWDTFYARCGEDEPVKPIVDMVKHSLAHDYKIIYCSGRRESCRQDTLLWLMRHCSEGDFLLLRKNGDHRHDTEVKPELIAQLGIPLDEIAFVLEDRNSMVKKWREMGLVCLQVAEGDF